ncbi:TPR-like protein [Atractiella rhizophila]|nr:TPR-like protein [Atractiella rhizophila]
MSGRDGRAPKVKNRAPATVQITAEQLLREAQERQEPKDIAPRQRIEDFEELNEYRARKRKEFEETIRRTRINMKAWVKYASWEASQGEYARSRSVYERALDVSPAEIKVWMSYTEMELKARNIQHARNLFDRAVTLLPRLDQLWYKYVFLEELLGNVSGARQIFERWMAWEPDEKAWSAYIKMEVRYGELDRASKVYERLVNCHPETKMWIKWAKFEEERGKLDRAREIFQMAMEFYGEEEDELVKAQPVYNAFGKLEIRHKEYERARVIYKYALDRLPKSKSFSLYTSYTTFEKQYGTRDSIESTVLGKRRIQYEDELSADPRQYDVWFDYTRLEEDAYRSAVVEEEKAKILEKVRSTYERAVEFVPPAEQKRYWRRYVFLWLNYAVFEEIETQDFDRTRDIYKAAMKVVPHKTFTFAKLWINYAKFELRRLNLDTARKIMGTAIGMCPKPKLFAGYLEIELQLREFDRCRTLYEKFVEYEPSNPTAWVQFAELEQMLDDTDRARAIYELAVSQSLDNPQIVWKSYIDFEQSEQEWSRARSLYDRLLEKSSRSNGVDKSDAKKETSNLKVWVAYSKFEIHASEQISKALMGETDEDEDEDEEQEQVIADPVAAEKARRDGVERARKVLERAYAEFKSKAMSQSRTAILNVWKALEQQHGDTDSLAKVEAKMPYTVRRYKKDENGQMSEEFVATFPDDAAESSSIGSSFLARAHAWKKQKMTDGAPIPVAAPS